MSITCESQVDRTIVTPKLEYPSKFASSNHNQQVYCIALHEANISLFTMQTTRVDCLPPKACKEVYFNWRDFVCKCCKQRPPYLNAKQNTPYLNFIWYELCILILKVHFCFLFVFLFLFFIRHEQGRYPRKDYATYWECEEYPKAWGHGSKENPLPPNSVPREKGPLRDRIWFKEPTTIPRLPKSLEPVPNK